MGQVNGAVKIVKSGQIQLFQNEKVIIIHHKLTEINKCNKTDIFPVLGKLTHMNYQNIAQVQCFQTFFAGKRPCGATSAR